MRLPAFIYIIILAIGIDACLLVSSCSTWKQGAYKTTGTVVLTADTAMKAWAAYVAAGQAKPEQEAKVRDAYGKYQASMLAVIDAGKVATTSGNQDALRTAVAAAAAAEAHLLEIIATFVPAKNLKP